MIVASLGMVNMNAQEAESVEDVKTVKEGKVRIMMIQDENGNVTKSDETFSIDDEQKLEEVKALLKEKGVEMDIDELIKNSLMEIKLDDEDGSDHVKYYQIKTKEVISNDENGDEDEVILEWTDGNMEEMEMDEETKKRIEESMNKFHEAVENGEYKEMDGNTKVIVKKRVVNVEDVDSDEDFNKVVVNKFVFETDEEFDGKKGYMLFVRKSSKVTLDEEMPTEIVEKFDNQSNLDELNLYPNPANGMFNMSFTSKEPQDYTLTIVDAKGSTIYEKQLNAFEGNFKEEYDLSDHDSGLYFFNLVSEKEKLSKKIIVQ